MEKNLAFADGHFPFPFVEMTKTRQTYTQMRMASVILREIPGAGPRGNKLTNQPSRTGPNQGNRQNRQR
jgi:hypothetical protein